MTQRHPLPPKAFPLETLSVEEEIKSSSIFQKDRAIFHAYKEVKEPGIKKHYFFKKPMGGKNDRLLELEAYGSAICRFLATEEYAPYSHLYYDAKTEIIGIATIALPDFKPNSVRPLKISDMEIDSLSLKIEHQKNIVLSKIKKLLLFLEKNPEEKNYSQEAGLFEKHFYGFKNSYLNRNIKEYLTRYLQNPDPLSNESLSELIKNLIHYKNKLKYAPLKDEYYNLLCKKVIFASNSVNKLQHMGQLPKKLNDMDIESLEDLHQNQKNDEIKISDIQTQKNLKNYQKIRGLATSLVTRYIYKEGDNNNTNMSCDGLMIDFGKTKQNIQYQYAHYKEIDKLLRKPDSKTYQCTARDIDFFPNIQDAEIPYWPTKKSPMINRFIWMTHDFIDAFFNYKPDEDKKGDTFEEIVNFVTHNLARHFQPKPKIKSFVNTIAESVYSTIIKLKSYQLKIPEEEFILQQQKIELAYSIKFAFDRYMQKNYKTLMDYEKELRLSNHIEDATFTIDDNKNFKALSHHPVFIFHKYKTFLKYILTTKEMYASLAPMYIASHHQELINKLIIDEENRLKEIRNILVSMPEFKQFLKCYGTFAFELIKNEISTLKNIYAKKSKPSESYKAFEKSLDIGQLESNYKELVLNLDIEYVSKNKTRASL